MSIGLTFGFSSLLVLALFLLLSSRATANATTLEPGDIAIIGFNSDAPDEYAFVLLRDVSAGTTITFTDNGWMASGEFRGNEGHGYWTAGVPLSAGTVISGPVGTMAFAAAGDQILAYQGSDSSPSFVYAVHRKLDGARQVGYNAWVG